MFERFTDGARNVLVRAQEDARRLGHGYIGSEHLLLAAAEADEPVGAILRDQGVTPERVEAEIVRAIGRGPAAGPGDPLRGLDREALAAIGIDLDVVRARIEAAFGPNALGWPAPKQAARFGRPAWGKGPVAELMRRRRRRRARRGAPPGLAPRALGPRVPVAPPGGHIRLTPRAKKSLELSLREANALHDDRIDVQHLILAQLAIRDGMAQVIVSALGASSDSLRAAILARYRKAG